MLLFLQVLMCLGIVGFMWRFYSNRMFLLSTGLFLIGNLAGLMLTGVFIGAFYMIVASLSIASKQYGTKDAGLGLSLVLVSVVLFITPMFCYSELIHSMLAFGNFHFIVDFMLMVSLTIMGKVFNEDMLVSEVVDFEG